MTTTTATAAQTIYADPTQELTSAVRRFDRRQRAQQTVMWLPRGLMAALLIGIAVAVIARLRPLLTNMQVAWFVVGVGIAAIFICLVVIWARRRSQIALARHFDLDFGLRERVSTALELHAGQIRAPEWLAAEQIADAQATATEAALHVKDRLPLPISLRDWLVVILLAAVVAVLLILPNPAADALSRDAAVAEAINDAAADLQNAAEDIAADPSLEAQERQALLEDLRQRIDSLQDPNITPEEAFASLSEASAEFQEHADALGTRSQAAQNALQQAADSLRQAGDGTTADSNAPLQQVTSQLQQISQNASQMSEADRRQAAQALRDASASLQNGQQNSGSQTQNSSQQQAAESLQNAADSLQNGDTQQAQQQLSQVQQQLQQSAQESQQQQQGQQDMNDAAQQARDAASQISDAQQQQQQGESSDQPPQNSQQSGERGSPQQSDQQSGQSQQSGQQLSGEGSQENPQGQLQNMTGQSDQSGTGQQDQTSQQSANMSAGDAAGTNGDDSNPTRAGDTSIASQDNNPDGQGERQFEAVNVPRHIGGDMGDSVIQLDADASNSPVKEGDFAQNPNGQVTVPYNQVYGDYRNTADHALDSGYVPLGLRGVIRDYFTSLDPSQR